jgi:type IV pilus assembly protein PilV
MMFIKKSAGIPDGICKQGFTLIEVLIAMAIFAIGILAVGSMQISAINTNVSAINTNALARNSTTVVTMAKDRAEQLMALPYNDDIFTDLTVGEHSVAAGSFTQATDGIDNNEDGQIDEAGETGHISIEWNVTESDLSGDGDNDSKLITVTVTRVLRGRQKRASLDFIKADI